ncbi:LuxR family transcriptional regulator [Kitasatospora sp. MBT63]|uniref:helix-turn-helix transcriptional regulator n=1 Tax=Kitasatospora sp. MBT63 TaxID=1444768 RepID=UPI0011EA6901|nr:LuxR family transcriptional regulator [Kitasatospora sp. MBT63]
METARRPGARLAVAPGPEGPMTGRDEELAAILAALRTLPAVVRVTAPAGLGKTLLLGQAAGALRADGLRVLETRCPPLARPFPFGAVAELLRTVGPDLPAAPDPVTGALAELLPEAAQFLPPPPPPASDPDLARHRVFRAVRAVLAALGPTVLVVDGLQWADPDSLELLRALTLDPVPAAGLLLAGRPSEVRAAAAPHRPPGVGGAELRLTPLDEEQTARLTARRLGAPAPSVAAELHRWTGGAPHLLVQVLDRLAPAPERLDAAAVDEALRRTAAALVQPVETGSAAVDALVRACAVVGRPAEQELLATVAGLPPETAGAALLEALGTGRLTEPADCRYGLPYPLLQQAVHHAVPGPERRRAHLAAAHALLAAEPVSSAELARHLRAAGDLVGWREEAEAAVDHAVAAGDSAAATELLHQLLAEPSLPPEHRSRAALTLARVCVNTLDHQQVLAVLRRIVTTADLAVVTRGEVRLTLGLLLLNQEGDTEAAFRELECCVGELRERPDLAARAMGALAAPILAIHATQQAHWLDRAERAARLSGDPVARTGVLASRVTWLACVGDPTAWQLLAELPRNTPDQAELRQTARALCNAASGAVGWGLNEQARRYLDEGLDLAEATGMDFMQGVGRAMTLVLDWHTARLDGLEARARALHAEISEMPALRTDVLLVLAHLHALHGEFDEASAALEPLLTGGHGPDPMPFFDAHALSTRLALADGNAAQAWRALTPVLELYRTKAVWAWGCELVPEAVLAALAAGADGEARRLAEEFARHCAEHPAPAVAAGVELALGHLAVDHDPAAAADHYQRAAAVHGRIGRRYARARATELAALARLAAGQRPATPGLVEAAEEYERLGAVADSSRCAMVLREQGIGDPRAHTRRGYGEELTPRELEVARLLASGRTNREIAQVLFLSPRTVEQHVAKVLRKLRVPTRREVRTALGPRP